MQQLGSRYFACRSLGSNGQNSTFPEHGHDAYQIKVNDTCSNKVAIFYTQTPSPDPGGGVKIQLFAEPGHIAYQIKWN